ncbi:outer membrane lipoprotein chaperone LolA [Bowmanella denitrificans]|uniref:outer membrane lipoprotein chaperone LolA n=1 Tax=Bowmanella denitrificans TaxID=366582 RepID=UPI000C99FFAD|nr:outer membrane lipoprotein chaperone LolA [Bowmanella denitrificans]
MKRLLTIGFCVLAFPTLANEAANSLKSKLSQLHSFQADFEQQVTDGQGQAVQHAQGTLHLQQPDKLRWELKTPDEALLIADGQTVWHVDPFVSQAIALDQQGAIENNPLILLAQPDSHLWQDFTVSQESSGYLIRSKSDNSQIDTLTLTFDGQTLLSLSLLDRQQQKSVLNFRDIKQNIDLPAALFKFTLPEGYELDDQRQVQTGNLQKP